MADRFEKWLEEAMPFIRKSINLRSKNLNLRSGLLGTILPITSVPDFVLATMRYNPGNRMVASMVAWDGDIPMDKPRKVSNDITSIQQIKHALGTEYNSIDIMKLEEVQNRLASQGNSDAMRVFSEAIFPRMEWLTDAINERVLVMGWQSVTTGKLTHQDTRTKFQVDIDFGADPSQFLAYNPALDWSLPGTPGLRILLDDIEGAKDRARGRYPTRVIVHSRELKNLLLQDGTKQFLLSARGSSLDPTLFSSFLPHRAELNAFLTAQFGAMEIVVFDETYEDTVGGVVTEIPFLPKGMYSFAWSEGSVNNQGVDFEASETPNATFLGAAGSIVFGPHPDNGFRQGFFTNMNVVSRDPLRVTLTASAVAVPFIDQPELLFTRVAGNPA